MASNIVLVVAESFLCFHLQHKNAMSMEHTVVTDTNDPIVLVAVATDNPPANKIVHQAIALHAEEQ